MKRKCFLWLLIALLPVLAGGSVLIGCARIARGMVPPESLTAQETLGSTTETASTSESASGSPDRIFFDNSQAMYGLTGTEQYGGVLHALMQAEALEAPECYTLQAEDARTEDNLRWAAIDFNALKVSFTEKALYTFYQAGEPVPRLGRRGPLALLFDSGLVDPARLTLVVTDLTENDFGASRIAAALADVLAARDDTGLTLYGLTCSGFSGNVSYPAYTAKGTEIRTVLGYRGNAQAYILAIGPIEQLMAFDERFTEKLGGTSTLDKTCYWGGDAYPWDSGIGDFAALPAQKLAGGSADTLHTTVNAIVKEQAGDAFRFAYQKSTAGKYREEVQLTLLAPMTGDSPFWTEDLTAANLTVEQRGAGEDAAAFVLCDHPVELTAGALQSPLELWKEGAGQQDGTKASEAGGWLLQLRTKRPDKRTELRICFDLVAEAVANSDWIAEKSATLYEYQSLQDILPQAKDNDRHLVWTAGATDILSRTLDLTDVDQLLRTALPEQRVVRHIEIILTR